MRYSGGIFCISVSLQHEKRLIDIASVTAAQPFCVAPRWNGSRLLSLVRPFMQISAVASERMVFSNERMRSLIANARSIASQPHGRRVETSPLKRGTKGEDRPCLITSTKSSSWSGHLNQHQQGH